MNLLITIGLFAIFVILLLFVWRSREMAAKKAKLKATAYSFEEREETMSHP
jgi:hypothetical protein